MVTIEGRIYILAQLGKEKVGYISAKSRGVSVLAQYGQRTGVLVEVVPNEIRKGNGALDNIDSYNTLLIKVIDIYERI